MANNWRKIYVKVVLIPYATRQSHIGRPGVRQLTALFRRGVLGVGMGIQTLLHLTCVEVPLINYSLTHSTYLLAGEKRLAAPPKRPHPPRRLESAWPLTNKLNPCGLPCRIWSLLVKRYERTYRHPPENWGFPPFKVTQSHRTDTDGSGTYDFL